MPKIFASLFWLLLSLVALAGCGQKGPLYLPQQIPPQQTAPRQTPPPVVHSTPAAADGGAQQTGRKNKQQTTQQDADSSAKPQSAEAPEPQP